MRACFRTPLTWRAEVVAFQTVFLVLVGLVAAPVGLADPRVEEAEERTAERQAELDDLLAEIEALEAAADDLRTELASLEKTEAGHAGDADEASELAEERIRESYKRGSGEHMLSIVDADDAATATEQARLLALLATQSREDGELARAAQQRTGARAERVGVLVDDLEETETALSSKVDEARELVAEAEEDEEEVREEVRREEERQRREREEERQRREREEQRRLAAERASRSERPGDDGNGDGSGEDASTVGDAPSSGGVACPVGTPRNFSDTYGAARSGGRGHMGTDILAPMGTPVYAYEDGTITRTDTNRLGGITLYLRGDSGTVYYYAHLQGYAGGLSSGQRVSPGEQIATNGDSGNARGIPHLHIEVMPGGGGNVNPYPYMRRACG